MRVIDFQIYHKIETVHTAKCIALCMVSNCDFQFVKKIANIHVHFCFHVQLYWFGVIMNKELNHTISVAGCEAVFYI